MGPRKAIGGPCASATSQGAKPPFPYEPCTVSRIAVSLAVCPPTLLALSTPVTRRAAAEPFGPTNGGLTGASRTDLVPAVVDRGVGQKPHDASPQVSCWCKRPIDRGVHAANCCVASSPKWNCRGLLLPWDDVRLWPQGIHFHRQRRVLRLRARPPASKEEAMRFAAHRVWLGRIPVQRS